ncbi:class I SAM-dependent methyltransferase [Parendozoicomonas sp. Alg238-R29]|uniref:class I SAM-dependent methyltransferase n=1 Tax=Parendozoicomonas sp. Alg238-R29 TaxID=2993446 RepID=UPI00248ECEAB|nr:class I SAM-dependent methyltransferase [Parendozoicomonas sp. Alg238-R29]
MSSTPQVPGELSTSTDTSRISISALYTGHVWYRNGLSLPALYSRLGQTGYWLLKPINSFIKLLTGADIETFLLERHKVIDHKVAALIEKHPDLQIVEIACGLSPRGARIMSSNYAGLSYVEADLPDMAAKKQNLLQRLGLLNNNHVVQTCNILNSKGSDSLEHLLGNLDINRPVLIITEGLVNYFDLPVISDVWQRMAEQLKSFPAGYYVTEVYPDLHNHPHYKWMKRAKKVVALLTQGDYPLHYNSDESMKSGFEECGFHKAVVSNPSDYYQLLNMPKLKTASAVRIVECTA